MSKATYVLELREGETVDSVAERLRAEGLDLEAWGPGDHLLTASYLRRTEGQLRGWADVLAADLEER